MLSRKSNSFFYLKSIKTKANIKWNFIFSIPEFDDFFVVIVKSLVGRKEEIESSVLWRNNWKWFIGIERSQKCTNNKLKFFFGCFRFNFTTAGWRIFILLFWHAHAHGWERMKRINKIEFLVLEFGNCWWCECDGQERDLAHCCVFFISCFSRCYCFKKKKLLSLRLKSHFTLLTKPLVS